MSVSSYFFKYFELSQLISSYLVNENENFTALIWTLAEPLPTGIPAQIIEDIPINLAIKALIDKNLE